MTTTDAEARQIAELFEIMLGHAGPDISPAQADEIQADAATRIRSISDPMARGLLIGFERHRRV